MLYRSIDLERCHHTISTVGGNMYIKVCHKGWDKFQFEKVLSLPDLPEVSPSQLLTHYVGMTSSLPEYSPVLVSLARGQEPICADTIKGITKRALETYGLPSAAFGPHATRGAGIKLLDRFGLSPQQVADLDKWKNLEAFTKHYLRLTTGPLAETLIERGLRVHTSSPRTCAEPDSSQTPHEAHERGGREDEGGAQGKGEPTLPHQASSSPVIPTAPSVHNPSPNPTPLMEVLGARKRPRDRPLLKHPLPPGKLRRVEATTSRGRVVTKFVLDE